MPHIDARVTYHLELNAEELRIASLALLKRLRRKDDALAACRINHRLQQIKSRMAAAAKDAADKNEEAATAALSEASKEYADGRTRKVSRRGQRP